MEAPASLVVGFKNVAPPLDGAVERPVALASLRRAPAASKWLSAPSGSGKSTLVASCLAGAGKASVWYRLDARDNDPAFFYAHFAAAIGGRTTGDGALPSFADDDRQREDAFAARFFSEVVRQCPGTAFVFDDAHLVDREPIQRALAQFVALAAAEIWFIGEESPPAPFFDAIASRRLSLCNDVRLAFDVQECDSLAANLRVASVSGAGSCGIDGGARRCPRPRVRIAARRQRWRGRRPSASSTRSTAICSRGCWSACRMHEASCCC